MNEGANTERALPVALLQLAHRWSAIPCFKLASSRGTLLLLQYLGVALAYMPTHKYNVWLCPVSRLKGKAHGHSAVQVANPPA